MSANYSNVSMLDMVFERRNKAYGAYVLRRDYNKSLQTAIASILSVVTLFCFGNYISENMNINNKPGHKLEVVVAPSSVEKVQKEVIKPKSVPPAPKPQSIATAQNVERIVVEDDKAPKDSILTNDQIKDLESGIKTNTEAPSTGIGATDGTGKDAVFAVAKEVEPTPQVFAFVEEMPEFPGGEKALMNFIARNTEYPQMERDNGIGGKVITQFTVNEDGTISDVQILRSPSTGFNREVSRVIKKLPAFKPGRQQGRAVKVRYVMSFVFNLN